MTQISVNSDEMHGPGGGEKFTTIRLKASHVYIYQSKIFFFHSHTDTRRVHISIIMSDSAAGTSTVAAPAQVGTPKKPSAGKNKKPRVKPNHPRTSEMVIAAVKNLKERGGSSLQAIKKYISANYKVDAEKLAPFIKKYLKSAVTSGSLVQTKGKGASGSFKLSSAEKGSESKKATTSLGAKAASGKKPAAKKLTKKPAAGKSKAKKVAKTPSKSPAKSKKTAAPSKARKPAKGSPTKKPKAPKPKKATAKPAKARKAAPKKK